MSWLSEGLAKVGISKNFQRAATKPILAVAAPFTGGASTALIPFVNKPSTPQDQQKQGAIEQGFAQAAAQVIATSPSAAASAAAPILWEKYKAPIYVGLAAVGIGVVGYFVMRRKR